LKRLLCLVGVALLLGSETWPPSAPSPPLAGFSFSPLTSIWAHRDQVQDLTLLLDATNPDLVRLHIYWETVQPEPGRLDFAGVDSLIAAIARHNAVARTQTRVVLTVGARNFLYPELHEPAWAGPRRQPYLNDAQIGTAYRTYFVASVNRYRASPMLYAWQVENEPLDYVGNSSTGDDQIKVAQLSWEIAEVHTLDPAHKAVTTTFDGWNVAVDMMQLYTPDLLYRLGGWPQGHPEDALVGSDALGLDLYVDGPSTPLRFTSPGLRAEWKEQAVGFWAARAHSMGKDLWLSEMQAQPWSTSPGRVTASDLVDTAVDYRQEDIQVVLLWGVDTWLQDPAWLAAATQALAILRSS
jgi:hypothetical protein